MSTNLTFEDQQKIIDWICCEGQAKGILEDSGINHEEVSYSDIEIFIERCHRLLTHKLETGYNFS